MYKDKKNIVCWLEDHKISLYRIYEDETYGYVVDVFEDVFFNDLNLSMLPIQFRVVNGHFSIKSNNLKTLKGCPFEVTGNFNCSDNKIISLEHCPESIGKNFDCSKNKLNSLSFIPKYVGTIIYCDYLINGLGHYEDLYEFHLKERSAQQLSEIINQKIGNLSIDASKFKL